MKILIVDDEELIRNVIKTYCLKHKENSSCKQILEKIFRIWQKRKSVKPTKI